MSLKYLLGDIVDVLEDVVIVVVGDVLVVCGVVDDTLVDTDVLDDETAAESIAKRVK